MSVIFVVRKPMLLIYLLIETDSELSFTLLAVYLLVIVYLYVSRFSFFLTTAKIFLSWPERLSLTSSYVKTALSK